MPAGLPLATFSPVIAAVFLAAFLTIIVIIIIIGALTMNNITALTDATTALTNRIDSEVTEREALRAQVATLEDQLKAYQDIGTAIDAATAAVTAATAKLG